VGQPDDRSLLALVASGNEEALGELHTRYRPLLYRYLWYRLQDAGLVEDALQETFLKIWRAANTFRGTSTVAAWLFTIAHRQALLVQRHRRRQPEGHAISLSPELADTFKQEADPDTAILERLNFIEALRSLSPKQRDVLFLIFIQGFDTEETAKILEIPAGTVRSRLSYARRALAQYLQREQIAEDAI
jgi:RNA polymerase sigma-70 factor, ECF subfamily